MRYIGLLILWVTIVGALSCANEGRALNGQMRQSSLKLDNVRADSVVAAESAEVAADSADTECRSYERTIYKKDGRTIYFKVDSCMVYCYSKAGNRPPRKMIFGHE